jgi:hypothetical protein
VPQPLQPEPPLSLLSSDGAKGSAVPRTFPGNVFDEAEQAGRVGFPRDKGESGCRTVKVGHPNGAPQIPPLRFAPVGMTNRRGLLKRGRQLLGAGRLFNRQPASPSTAIIFCRESKKVGFPRDKGESGCKTVKVGHLHWVSRTETWRRSFLDANQTERPRHRPMVQKASAMVTK